MKKTVILLTSFVLIVGGCRQAMKNQTTESNVNSVAVDCNQDEDMSFPKAMNNKKTPSHTKVPDTKISIILPGFIDYKSNNGQTFVGSIGNDTVGIFFFENHNKNFYEMKNRFIPEFEKVYLSVSKEVNFTINNYPAIALYVRQNEKEGGYRILFGDSTFAAYIMTVHPNNMQNVKKQIFESLLTICYESDGIPNQ